eukprot:8602062-Alexandrium_andersonii.AAC.2
MTLLGEIVTEVAPGCATERVLDTQSWQPEVEPGADGPERTEHLKASRGLARIGGAVMGADPGGGVEREHVGRGHADHRSARPLTAQARFGPWRVYVRMRCTKALVVGAGA